MPNFPGSLDSFSNPTGSTPLAGAGALLHSLEHATTNDILQALETKLGQNPASTDALGYIYTGDNINKGLWVPVGALLQPGILINSNFDVAQRVGGSATTAPTTYNTMTSYHADRVYVLPAGAAVAQVRLAGTPPNNRSSYYLQIGGAAGVTTLDIGQRVRAELVQTFGLQSLVFSCYLFQNSGSAYMPNLRIGTPAASNNFTTVTNRLNQALQSCASNAWTRLFWVFDPSAYTNILNGMQVELRIPSGSMGAGVVMNIAQMDLRPGNHFMEYLPPNPTLEILRCQQYFQKSYIPGTAPGTGSLGDEIIGQASAAVPASTAGILITPAAPYFPLPMIAAPTVILYNASSGAANAIFVGGASSRTGATAGSPNTVRAFQFISLDATSATAIADRSQIQLHYSAVAEM